MGKLAKPMKETDFYEMYCNRPCPVYLWECANCRVLTSCKYSTQIKQYEENKP